VLNRLAQSLHGEFDIVGLEMAPAFDFRLVAAFREPLKVFRGELSSGETAIANPRKITRPGDFNDAPKSWWLSFPEALGARKHF
jgi:hypothetical protein